ncbi:MAG: PEGA domain-containing protein [Deltaproteobacteria bacterium]|nr:MAG: PEGA domain-containing protein [Deltaproteobacteria bacterium]
MTSHFTRLATLVVIVVAASALSPRAALAANPPTQDEIKAAGALYEEGQRLFAKELYAAAIEKFQAANAIIEHEVNYYNIARSYEKLGAAEECVKGYETYVDFFKKKHGADPKDIVDVRASVQKCRLLMRPEVTIGSDPEGAKVYIDSRDKLLGQTPYKTTLDPGSYTLFLDLAGYQPFEQKFEVRAGEPIKLYFKLEKLQRVGSVSVKSNIRGAAIFIDGRNIGLTPYAEKIVLDEGQHQITVQKDEYIPFSRGLNVEVAKDEIVTSELYLRDPPMTWKGYVGYISIALGAGGIGFGYFAKTRADVEFTGTDEFNKWEGLQNIGYGAGGGLVGVGVLLLVLEALDTDIVKSEDALEEARTSPRIVPIVTATGNGGLLGADVRF